MAKTLYLVVPFYAYGHLDKMVVDDDVIVCETMDEAKEALDARLDCGENVDDMILETRVISKTHAYSSLTINYEESE